MDGPYLKPEVFLLILMGVPFVISAFLARNRGRNILFWGLLSALFPVFIMVIYFKPPLREVAGGFRCCRTCGEYIKWKATICKYCSTPVINEGHTT